MKPAKLGTILAEYNIDLKKTLRANIPKVVYFCLEK